ncbi:HAD hydrolase-like protein [Actinomyces israelii]|uniref:HAD hydrolase-like protein n=1 Tax=Actinomyces israelii TaxID=1659 RepID=A0ABT4I481_9ACTO|nr:HAD hydrolase-like protein [Actinomyces israelii]MCZ0856541.1 HAD hydrolase-like protein [Actinomyces israelii]
MSTRSSFRPARGSAGEFSAVLLDLDGTVTDSAPVILASFCAAFDDLGIVVPDRARLMSFVGPPLAETFARYAGLTGRANARAVAAYRSHYRELMYRAPVYKGVPALVRSLHESGVPLALATSKRESLARLIIEHTGLGPCFDAVTGAADDDRGGEKAVVIARALVLLSAAGADTSRVVHVGDRSYDVEGARQAGVECIGALWGYGDADELAGAQWLAADVPELASLLGAEV